MDAGLGLQGLDLQGLCWGYSAGALRSGVGVAGLGLELQGGYLGRGWGCMSGAGYAVLRLQGWACTAGAWVGAVAAGLGL